MLGFFLGRRRDQLVRLMLMHHNAHFSLSPIGPNARDYNQQCELLGFCYFCWFMAIENSGMDQLDQSRMHMRLRDNSLQYITVTFLYFASSRFENEAEKHTFCINEGDRLMLLMQERAAQYKTLFISDQIEFGDTSDKPLESYSLFRGIAENVYGHKDYNIGKIMDLYAMLFASCVALR